MFGNQQLGINQFNFQKGQVDPTQTKIIQKEIVIPVEVNKLEVNKAIVRRFYEEVFNQRNVELIDELVRTEFINHDPTPVASRDRKSMKQFIKTLTIAFPDHHHQIQELIAEGDKVVMCCTLTATHQGIFPGFLEIPPTGKSICQPQIHILRVQDHQISEHFVVRDDMTIMQQLGVIPDPKSLHVESTH